MYKKQVLLCFLLIISIILLGIVIFIVIDNVKTVSYRDKIKGHNWVYVDSIIYENSDNATMKLFESFSLKLYDDKAEVCIESICDNYNYYINNNILAVEDTFIDGYKILFDEEYLILEKVFDDTKKTLYRFVVPVG